MLTILVLLLILVALIALGASVVGFAVQLLWWALIGLAIGALARLIVPGMQPIGLLRTTLLGIGGALIGGIIANAVDAGGLLEFVMAVLVAAILVALLGGTGRARRRGRDLSVR